MHFFNSVGNSHPSELHCVFGSCLWLNHILDWGQIEGKRGRAGGWTAQRNYNLICHVCHCAIGCSLQPSTIIAAITILICADGWTTNWWGAGLIRDIRRQWKQGDNKGALGKKRLLWEVLGRWYPREIKAEELHASILKNAKQALLQARQNPQGTPSIILWIDWERPRLIENKIQMQKEHWTMVLCFSTVLLLHLFPCWSHNYCPALARISKLTKGPISVILDCKNSRECTATIMLRA